MLNFLKRIKQMEMAELLRHILLWIVFLIPMYGIYICNHNLEILKDNAKLAAGVSDLKGFVTFYFLLWVLVFGERISKLQTRIAALEKQLDKTKS